MNSPPPSSRGDPPPDGGVEVIEELDDDSIIAAQSAAHAPAHRAEVRMENASVVIAEEEAPRPERAKTMPRGLRNDPTIVLKRPPGLKAPKKKKSDPAWISWVIWGGAGVVAFGAGGILASVLGRGEPDATPPVSAAPAPVAAPAPRVTRTTTIAVPAAEPDETSNEAVADGGAASSEEKATAAPAPKKPIRAPRLPRPPVAPKPPGDIPSGI